MDNKKILKLFKQFAGDPLDIHGLMVTPVKVKPSNQSSQGVNMFFRVTNPNDVSYFSPIVQNYIYEETTDFSEFIKDKIAVYFEPSFEQGDYFNQELKSKIQKVFNSVKVIEFRTRDRFFGYERYKLLIKSVGVSTGYWDEEKMHIINKVKAVRAEKNGEWWDPKVVVGEYLNVFLPSEEYWWETENLYSNIDNILNEDPLLKDPYGMVSCYYDTKFIQ